MASLPLSPKDTYQGQNGMFQKPNNIHQADLLFLPHDVVGQDGHLNTHWIVIDVASRYKDAEALTSKESGEVAVRRSGKFIHADQKD